MSYVEYFDLEKIQSNPYQTRSNEDPEHIRNLAESIASVGLLQIPTGRLTSDGNNVQLAFGHSRLAALKLLHEQKDNQYREMPVNIQPLTDEQMFVQAVAENHDRKDLSPIETARAMKIYKDKFGKTSREIGELFHLSPSAVRNKLRLLGLPEDVQEKVDGGELTEGSARTLLQVQKVAPEDMERVIRVSGGNSDEIERLAGDAVRTSDNTYEMWAKWQGEEPRAGDGLWLLREWTPTLPETLVDGLLNHYEEMGKLFEKAMEQSSEGPVRAQAPACLAYFERMKDAYESDPYGWTDEFPEWDDRTLDILSVLVDQSKPCSQCPMYLVKKGTHYCGFKPCWQWRKKQYTASELERVSEEMGVSIYDKGADGECLNYRQFKRDWRYGDQSPLIKSLFELWIEQGNDSLRIKKAAAQHYGTYDFTDHHFIQLVCVGQEALEQVRDIADLAVAKDDTPDQYEIDKANRSASQKWIKEVVLPVFEQAVHHIHPGFMRWSFGGYHNYPSDGTDEEKLAFARRRMIKEVIGSLFGWHEEEKGPEWLANRLRSDAKLIGVKLPADWDEVAKGYIPDEWGSEVRNKWE